MIVVIAVVLIPTFVLTVVVVIVVMPTIAVAIMVMVPLVIVLHPSARAVPVTTVIAATFIVWNNPGRAFVRTTRPIARVPVIVPADRIPVTIYPGILRLVLRLRTWRPSDNHPRRWWCSNLNPNGYLAERCRCSSQECTRQKQRASPFLPVHVHLSSLPAHCAEIASID